MSYRPYSDNSCEYLGKSTTSGGNDQNYNLYVCHLAYPSMQFLVTGTTGFIRGHLAESFVDAGHDVTTLNILEPFYDLDLKTQRRRGP